MQIGKEMAIPSILKIGNGALGKGKAARAAEP